MVRVTEVLAGRVGVAAFDLVNKAVVEEELQRPVDRRRRDLLALQPCKAIDDRIGAQRA